MFLKLNKLIIQKYEKEKQKLLVKTKENDIQRLQIPNKLKLTNKIADCIWEHNDINRDSHLHFTQQYRGFHSQI